MESKLMNYIIIIIYLIYRLNLLPYFILGKIDNFYIINPRSY